MLRIGLGISSLFLATHLAALPTAVATTPPTSVPDSTYQLAEISKEQTQEFMKTLCPKHIEAAEREKKRKNIPFPQDPKLREEFASLVRDYRGRLASTYKSCEDLSATILGAQTMPPKIETAMAARQKKVVEEQLKDETNIVKGMGVISRAEQTFAEEKRRLGELIYQYIQDLEGHKVDFRNATHDERVSINYKKLKGRCESLHKQFGDGFKQAAQMQGMTDKQKVAFLQAASKDKDGDIYVSGLCVEINSVYQEGSHIFQKVIGPEKVKLESSLNKQMLARQQLVDMAKKNKSGQTSMASISGNTGADPKKGDSPPVAAVDKPGSSTDAPSPSASSKSGAGKPGENEILDPYKKNGDLGAEAPKGEEGKTPMGEIVKSVTDQPEKRELTKEEIEAKARAAVVKAKLGPGGEINGTAVLVKTESGVIAVTNDHVSGATDQKKKADVGFDKPVDIPDGSADQRPPVTICRSSDTECKEPLGQLQSKDIQATYHKEDLTIYKADSPPGTTPLEARPAGEPLKPGEKVYVAGYPGASNGEFRMMECEYVGAGYNGLNGRANDFKCAGGEFVFVGGMSGGAVMDSQGRLVSVTSAHAHKSNAETRALIPGADENSGVTKTFSNTIGGTPISVDGNGKLTPTETKLPVEYKNVCGENPPPGKSCVHGYEKGTGLLVYQGKEDPTAQARAEEQRRLAEAQAKAEEQRKLEEARAREEDRKRLQAEADRQQAEEQKMIEQRRQEAEAQAKAEEQRKLAEAQAKAEEQRRLAEARRAEIKPSPGPVAPQERHGHQTVQPKPPVQAEAKKPVDEPTRSPATEAPWYKRAWGFVSGKDTTPPPADPKQEAKADPDKGKKTTAEPASPQPQETGVQRFFTGAFWNSWWSK